MTKELEEAFADWWNSDYLLPDNPYKKDSKAYWAWEGYIAGISAVSTYIANHSTGLLLKPSQIDISKS